MKDCKWNPPTLGTKGQLFDIKGGRVSREGLSSVTDGSVLLKFIDDTADRESRKKAEKMVAHWRKTGELENILSGAVNTPHGWQLHVREAVTDRKDPLEVAAGMLDVKRMDYNTRHRIRRDRHANEALTTVIMSERRYRLGLKSSFDDADGALAAIISSSRDIDLASFVANYAQTLSFTRLTSGTRYPDNTPMAAVVFALRAKSFLDTHNLFYDERDAALCEAFRYRPEESRVASNGNSDRFSDPSAIDADVLKAFRPLFATNPSIGATSLDVARAFRDRYEYGQAVLFARGPEHDPGIQYSQLFTAARLFVDLNAQHPARTEPSLGQHLEDHQDMAWILTQRPTVNTVRSMLLAADLMPEGRSDKKRFSQLQQHLSHGFSTGRIAGPSREHAAAYLKDPYNARPYAAIERGADHTGTPRAGAINASILGLTSLHVPSEVVAAVKSYDPAYLTKNVHSTRELLDGTKHSAPIEGTAWDTVEVSANPSAQELVCVAALAAFRATIDEQTIDLADRIAAPASLADLTVEVAHDVERDGYISDLVRARLAAHGLSHRLAADDRDSNSTHGVKEFTDACQDFFAGESFQLSSEAAPAAYRAARRFADETKNGTKPLDRDALRERLKQDRVEHVSGDGVLVEEAVLAQMRTAGGSRLDVTAAAFIRPLRNGRPPSEIAIVMTASTNANEVASHVSSRLPALAASVYVLNDEVRVDVTGHDPVAVLEDIDAAINSL